jgi:hypothetical protein
MFIAALDIQIRTSNVLTGIETISAPRPHCHSPIPVHYFSDWRSAITRLTLARNVGPLSVPLL